MKKFGLALLALFVIGTGIVILMVSQGGSRQLSNFDDTSNISANVSHASYGQKARVIAVSLADPVVQRIREKSESKWPIQYIEPGDTGVYLNDSGRYAGVYLNGTAVPGYAAPVPGASDYMLEVIVDTYTMKEMGVFYGGMPSFMNSWLIIPSGNGIYEKMSAGYNIIWPEKEAVPLIGSSVHSMELMTPDAKLCPLILDEDNFNKFMNGSPYEVPVLIDPDTGKTVRPDGTMPLIPGWSGMYILPAELQPHNMNSGWNAWYYVVLFNRGSEDVRVKYVSPFPPLLE